MEKSESIRIYLRLRPPATAQHSSILGGASRGQRGAGSVDTETCDYRVVNEFNRGSVHFHADKRVEADYVNNTSEDYSFTFRHVFEPGADQLSVFNVVAKDCVQSALDGYNSTIFAYGQTGSGKTYSITGGTESYEDRGIIPRALGLIYDETARRSDYVWNISIAYLQIYNDKGQDLLNHGMDAKTIEDLPTVTVHEVDTDTTVLRNLEQHAAPTLASALDLLFLGDMNRLYCETPMNRTSSRSHCVFTVHIVARAVGSSVVRRSKLNLVDLAGSERVSKTGVSGTILSEAKHINLSLHHLAHVIVALSEQANGKRDHVPFRNAFMTMVLRDSLGGNCRTSMLATAHLAKAMLPETISTCGFAQRVAQIRQEAKVNEEVDPLALAAKLKREVAQLRDQLAFYEGGAGEGRGADRTLTEEERAVCRGLVDAYVRQPDPPQHRLDGFEGDLARVYYCFEVMRERIVRCEVNGAGAAATGSAAESGEVGRAIKADYDAQIARLQRSLQQRENEVNTMFELVSQSQGGARFNAATQTPSSPAEWEGGSSITCTSNGEAAGLRVHAAAQTAVSGALSRVSELAERGKLSAAQATVAEEYLRRKGQALAAGSSGVAVLNATGGMDGFAVAAIGSDNTANSGGDSEKHGNGYNLDALSDAALVEDRAAAFDAFKQSCAQYTAVEATKVELKAKYDACKQTAASLNSTVDTIKETKTRVQRLRAERAVAGVDEVDPQEAELMQSLAAARERYNTLATSLREQKETIDVMHAFMKRAQGQLARDFDAWFAARRKQVGLAANGAANGRSHEARMSPSTVGVGDGGGDVVTASAPSASSSTNVAIHAIGVLPSHNLSAAGGNSPKVWRGSAPAMRPPSPSAGGASALPKAAASSSTAFAARHPSSAPSASTVSGRLDSANTAPPAYPQATSDTSTPTPAAVGVPRSGGWMTSGGVGGSGSATNSANANPYLVTQNSGDPNHSARNHHLQPLTPPPPPAPVVAISSGFTDRSSSPTANRNCVARPLSVDAPIPLAASTSTAAFTPSSTGAGYGTAAIAVNPYAPAHRSTGSRAADEQLAALYRLRDSMRSQML